MKINTLITKILILYLFILITFFSAFYCLMPSYFDALILFVNLFITAFVLLISTYILYKNINKLNVKHSNCDIIYWICKNIPFINYLLHTVIAIIICLIFRKPIAYIISSLSIFTYNIFYIFSKKYFVNILNYSESTLRPSTISISAKKTAFFSNIPLNVNLVLEFLPLLIIPLIVYLCSNLTNTAFFIFVIGINLISIISVIYISIQIYRDINNVTLSINNSNFNNYNNDFSNLIFNINATKQIYNDYIQQLQNTQNKELEKEHLASIEILRRTVDAKDTYTRGHSDRVSEYSVLIGEKLNLKKEDLKLLRIGALFHDIGKIGIPDNILLKNSKLTDDEYKEIKKHPSIGAHILENSTIFSNILPIILYHHERFDGCGYPNGIKGNDIPLMARIVSIADTFDAMTSKRTYRDSLSLDKVKQEFKKCSGTQFDPNLSELFLNILNFEYEKIEKIKKYYS